MSPMSLCNACGIKSRKKKRTILGIRKGSNEDRRKGKTSSNSSKVGGGGGLSLKHSQRLFAFGRQVLMQSHCKKLGEEEQVPVLLMSLSYGRMTDLAI
ncbi:GATA transcription factor 15-like [Gastrolobium bilobum]|uniref:GATA transcription factor 15-like n=1 Tax=Gastrolobium bilobum TaxID=150636 RepID=UPI002AAF71B7|nr:GATA transcription factor 15-like [Gastrolobium bilobum]